MRRTAARPLAAVLLLVASGTAAQQFPDPEREAMYARYMGIPALVRGGTICSDAGLLGGAACAVNWMPDGQSFWFAEGQPDQTVIQKADPALGTVEPLFDVERVRQALAPLLGHDPAYQGLPFDRFTFVAPPGQSPGPAIQFTVEERAFRMSLDDYAITPVPPAETEAAERMAPREVRPGFFAGQPGTMEVPSPDGRWLLGERDHDLWIRSGFDGREQPVLEDGEPDYEWVVEGASWAPDGNRAAVMKVDSRSMPRVPIVHWLKQTEEVEYAPFTKAGNPYAGDKSCT